MLDLWDVARQRLEPQGAEVLVTDFPFIERYERYERPRRTAVPHVLDQLPDTGRSAEQEHFLPVGWDDFLRANGDPTCRTLAAADPDQIAPRPPGTLPDRFDDEADRFANAVAFRSRRHP